jgi:hypothetical protein
MSTLSVRLPESLYRRLRERERRKGIFINQFISSAVGEKLAALATEDYLAARAARGNRASFEALCGRSRMYLTTSRNDGRITENFFKQLP